MTARNVTRETTNYGWAKVFAGLVAIQTGLRTVLEAIDAKFYARGYVYLPFDIPATELAAGTSIEVPSPVDGTVVGLTTIVQTAIVTGGAVTAKIGTTDIAGLSITVADSATKGTVQSDTPTAGHASRDIAAGDRIQIVPSSAFNGGGAVSGFIKIQID